jgi:hypothetical protein
VVTDRFKMRRSSFDYDNEQPAYLRVLENQKYHKSPSELAGGNGILTVMSKTRGWLTVKPENTDRKATINL